MARLNISSVQDSLTWHDGVVDSYGYIGVRTVGTTSTQGVSSVTVGNSLAAGVTGNARGRLLLYGTTAHYGILYGPEDADVSFYMPNTGGTLVTHATRGTAVGSATKPVYVAATGRATACSTYAGGTAVTLNGTSKAASTASLYAPTGAGTTDQVLYSNGSGAPTFKWMSRVRLDATANIAFLKDGDYYYFRPWEASTTLCGSSARPWYKVYTERLEVTVGRLQAVAGYTNTCTYNPNTYTGSSGLYTRTTNTSSKTIKNSIDDIVNEDLNPELLYQLPIHQFKYNEGIITDITDCRYDKTLPGFIIEEMDEIYPIAIDKPSENVAEWSWNQQYLIPPMLKLIQDQKKEIELLKKDIKELKGE